MGKDYDQELYGGAGRGAEYSNTVVDLPADDDDDEAPASHRAERLKQVSPKP